MQGRAHTVTTIAWVAAIAVASHVLATAPFARDWHRVWLLEHVGFLFGFGAVFAHSLLDDGDALITRIARTFEPDLPAVMVRYTRHATRAWVVFFVAMILASLTLYATQPFATWSALAYFGTPVAVAAMFVGEALVHRWRHPDHPRPTIAACLQAFAQRGRARSAHRDDR